MTTFCRNRILPALVLAACAVLIASAGASATPSYAGSTSATSTGVPGGGGGSVGGRVLFYDLQNTDADVSWLSPDEFTDGSMCGYLSPLIARNRPLTPSQRALCEQRVTADILGVNADRISPSGDSQCTIASAGPCWHNAASDPHGVSAPPRTGRSGYGELHWSNYGDSNAVSTAGTVIAWNIKVWRYDPYSGVGRNAEPIFERRVGISPGAATDDGTAPNCSSSSATGCVDQEQWWRGGTDSGRFWWADGAQAGPLGPSPESAQDDACRTRWSAYRSKWKIPGRPAALTSYVGLRGGEACFWTANDGSGGGYDTSVPPFPAESGTPGPPFDMESIAIGWTLTKLPGQVSLKYRIAGRPGYLYAVLVTPIDQREQIVGPGQVQGRTPSAPGGYFRSYFASSSTPGQGQICGTTYINRTAGQVSPERGIAGVRIRATGPASASVVSGAGGRYCVGPLVPGRYTIVATTPAGAQPRVPNPPRLRNVPAPAGGTTDDQDFHFFLPGGGQLRAGISGYAFEDLNQDGRYQPADGEHLLPGVGFRLGGAANANQGSADGNFAFSNLAAGSYLVAATPPAGYTPTNDSDGEANGRNTVTPIPITAGQQRGDVFFGFYRPCVGCDLAENATGAFPEPQVTVGGPNTAITGRANSFGITTDWPAGGIGYDQALWPLSSTTVLLDPQSGESQTGPDGASVAGYPFYERLMSTKELTQPAGSPYASAPTANMSPCPGQAPGTPCGAVALLARSADSDIVGMRDDAGAAGNNAAVIPNQPFQERGFDLAWLTPSLNPKQPASIGGYATYQAGRLVQPVSEVAEAEGNDWREPQTSCGQAPAGSHCITSDDTLRPWAEAAGMRLSDMHSSRHQLAQAYQYHPFDSGFLSAHLTTNDPDRVESLSVYDRGSENGSRKGRIFANTQVAASQLGISVAEAEQRRSQGRLWTREDAEGWNIYFCRSGGFADARIFNGTNLTFGRNDALATGDQGCRGATYSWGFDDQAADCRQASPTTKRLSFLKGVNGSVPAGAQIRGEMPWEVGRRCEYLNPDGYVQSGTWDPEPYQWDVDAGCTLTDPRTHRAPDGQAVPASGVIRCTTAAGRRGYRTGHWFRPGYTFRWTGTCARTKPNLADMPAAPAAWGNAPRYNDAGGRWVYPGTRTQTSRLSDERGGVFDADKVKRCTFRDGTGYQWNGSWVERPAEQGYGSPYSRLEAGEYTIVADFGTGAGRATTWRMRTNQFARRGSSWEWARTAGGGTELTKVANTVTTSVLALQTTR